MAEALLGNVLHKLAGLAFDKAINKALSLYGIKGEVEHLSRELKYIQAFMEDADRKHIVDQRQIQWVNDVISISYQIEDAIDIFHSECPEKLPGAMGSLRFFSKKITKIPFLYEFQERIKQIQGRISEMDTYRKRYEITTLGDDKIPQPEQKLDGIIDDSEIIGFKTDRDNVVNCLLDETNKSLAVVSILGTGGLGKTTLARKVCNSNDVIKAFGKPIWITVSKTFNLLKILEKMAKNINIDSTDTMDVNELATKIREYLEEKRFLIVFDDVWTEELWAEVENVLPDKMKGSRVLITTRLEDVAKVDTAYTPYKLPLLDDQNSLELFLKKAVPKNHQWPNPTSDLYSLAKKFVTKCQGLPLALKVLGGLLCKKEYKYHTWNEMLQTMSWQDEGIGCIKIIAASYEHLPLAKKLCFIYFAAFPEDAIIEIKSLLRMWVAEGLIPQERTRTSEETAEHYLEDLAQRSMVQISRSSDHYPVTTCGVHDLLRDLAVQKAKEMNFLITVCSKPDDWRSLSKARRLAIHCSLDLNALMGSDVNSNVRTLVFFGESSKLDCSKFKVLRVLFCEKNVDLMSFKGSPHLRYFQPNTACINNHERDFGEWISSMKYLETLDLRSAGCSNLSNGIWQVKTLKHVLLSPFNENQAPASIDLSKLQTLNNVAWNESWETSLPNIPEVRDLSIRNLKKFRERELASLLDTLEHIIHLKIEGDIDLRKISWATFPFYKKVKSLVIFNTGDRSDDAMVLGDDYVFPSHLIELKLFGVYLDIMQVLEKLENLRSLWISAMTNERSSLKRIRCSAGGFKQLEELRLFSLPLEEWEVEVGAMPVLKLLQVFDSPLLEVPSELIHVKYETDIDSDNEGPLINEPPMAKSMHL